MTMFGGLISVVPRGWLGYFGLKEQGSNPEAFEKLLRGAVTMNGFYQAAEELVIYQPASLGAGVYISGGPQVPAGKGWWVSHYACNAFTAANTYAECTAAVAPSDFSASNLALAVAPKGISNPTGVIGGGVATSAFINYSQPFWLPPLSQITPLYVVVGAANVDFRLFLRYREVTI